MRPGALRRPVALSFVNAIVSALEREAQAREAMWSHAGSAWTTN